MIWQIDNWVTAKLKTPFQLKDWLILAQCLLQLATRISHDWATNSLKFSFTNSMVCLTFFKNSLFLFIHIIIHILLWGVIHFLAYLFRINVTVFNVCLHLTSVWLCLCAVFVVTVQWHIDTNWMTSPFNFISLFRILDGGFMGWVVLFQ